MSVSLRPQESIKLYFRTIDTFGIRMHGRRGTRFSIPDWLQSASQIFSASKWKRWLKRNLGRGGGLFFSRQSHWKFAKWLITAPIIHCESIASLHTRNWYSFACVVSVTESCNVISYFNAPSKLVKFWRWRHARGDSRSGVLCVEEIVIVSDKFFVCSDY